MMNWGVLTGISKCLAAISLGAVILWETAENCTPATSEVVVHVCEGNAEVLIDDQSFWVDAPLATPIVCELRTGWHTLRMALDGHIVYEEEFHVAKGTSQVHCAWNQSETRRVQKVSDGSSPRP
jgi:hypothetical protein